MSSARGYFEIVNDALIFNGEYMEAYIPEDFFESSKGEIIDDVNQIFGIFNFKVFNKIDAEFSSSQIIHTFTFPSKMFTKPNGIEKRTMALFKGQEEKVFYVYKYYKGDSIMTSTRVVKKLDYVEDFINLMLGGKIPNTIKYSEIINLFKDNLNINGINLGVPDVVLEMIIAEVCRDKNDPSIPYRLTYNKTGDEYGYICVSTKELAALSSTFAGVTFEDIDTMLTSAINRQRYGEPSQQSPFEAILKV